MTLSKQSCSVFDPTDLQDDAELREILDALFCACLEDLQDSENMQRRDLFNLTEIKGQSLDAAAKVLGISVQDAEQMLAQTRREVAVLMVLGLCKPTAGSTPADAPPDDCNCQNA